MARRQQILPRERILVGAEGESERAFARWLREVCDDEGLRLHFDIVVAGGGDTRWIVEFAVRQRRRHNETQIRDSGAFVLLDADRVAADRSAGRDPETVPDREDLQLVYLRPNREGLLVRLHRRNESRFLSPNDAKRRLQQLWRDYDKPAPASALRQRFALDDLRLAAAHDSGLRDALVLLGLLPR